MVYRNPSVPQRSGSSAHSLGR